MRRQRRAALLDELTGLGGPSSVLARRAVEHSQANGADAGPRQTQRRTALIKYGNSATREPWCCEERRRDLARPDVAAPAHTCVSWSALPSPGPHSR